MLIADVLERREVARDPDAIVEAIKKTNYTGGLMQYAGPVVFNEIGDNPNAITDHDPDPRPEARGGLAQGGRLQKFVFPGRSGDRRRGRTAVDRPPHDPMDPTLIAQGLLSGLLFGGVYSLMAVGLTLIFGVMRVVNFAHGDMMVWGMYLAWLLATRAGDRSLRWASSCCAAALFALGVVVQRGLVDRIVDAPHEMQILLMLGVAPRARERARSWPSAPIPSACARR